MDSRYAPDTQNRQCALVQKIMMLAKLLCEHTEGFESGLRSCELENGNALLELRWQMQPSNTVMMNMALVFLFEYIRQQCRSSNSFVAMVLLIPKL